MTRLNKIQLASLLCFMLLAVGKFGLSNGLNSLNSTTNSSQLNQSISATKEQIPTIKSDTTSAELSSVDFSNFERDEVDLIDYIEKLSARYKNYSTESPPPPPVNDLHNNNNNNVNTHVPTFESHDLQVKTSANKTTNSVPIQNLVEKKNGSTSVELASGDNDAVESTWQYGIFDRFTRARSTTERPNVEPTYKAEDYRNFNSDDCGLRFYDGDYNTGKVGSYDTSAAAAAPNSPFADDYVPPQPAKPVREKYPTSSKFNSLSQDKSQDSSFSSSLDDDFGNSNSQHQLKDPTNLGLKHDWNKELFGHEQDSTSKSSSSSSDFNLDLSSRRNWRQQQIGQTLQHLGFNVSDIMSMRSYNQQNGRENLVKLSQPQRTFKTADSSDEIKSQTDNISSKYEQQSSVETLKLEPRVIGGTDARLGDSPWAVSLQALVSRPGTGSVEYRHYCGGTIISDRYVLTAAHCLDFMVGRESRLFVVIGDLQWRMTPSSTYGRRIPIEKLIIHAGYKSTAFGHDIGLIRTKEPMYPVKVNGRYIVNRVCLPERNVEHTGDAELVGWGLFSNRNEMADTLQIATVPILPRPLCVDLYRRRTGLIQWIVGIELITEKQVCASTFGRGICQGDSGSPLVYNEKIKRLYNDNNNNQPQVYNEQTRATIIGIVAFGGIRRCSYQSLPGVYMQTSKYMDWILPKIV